MAFDREVEGDMLSQAKQQEDKEMSQIFAKFFFELLANELDSSQNISNSRGLVRNRTWWQAPPSAPPPPNIPFF